MRTFKDAAGRDWTLALNFGMALKLKAEGIDLLPTKPSQDDFFMQLQTDVFTAFDLLQRLCEEQQKAAGVTPEAFAAAFDADATMRATEALIEEVTDFIQTIRKTDLYRRITTKATEIQTRAKEKAAKLLENGTLETAIQQKMTQMETDFSEAIAREMEKDNWTLGGLSGTLPAASELTPAL